VSLLSNSFFPQKKGVEAQVERCLVFVDENPESARRFYFFLPKFVPGDQVLDFTLKLYETVHQQIVDQSGDHDENAPEKQAKGKKGAKNRPAKAQTSQVSSVVLERGLEIVAISMESLFANTKEKKEKELTKTISEKFQEFPLEDLTSSLKTASVQSSIMALAGHLSVKDVSTICDRTLARLKSVRSCSLLGLPAGLF